MEKEIGVKLDKDKPEYGTMLIDWQNILKEVYKVFEFGKNKYGLGNWKMVANGEERFTNALIRHLFAEEDEIIDSETNLLHATHVAVNALYRLHFILLKHQTVMNVIEPGSISVEEKWKKHLEEN